MRLKPADIDRILEDSVGRPREIDDYAEENAAARDALVESLASYRNQSTAREGQILPPPPKSLTTIISGPNDFGIGNVQHHVVKEEIRNEAVLPPALRGADLDKIECRADLMKVLISNLPLNELGLPKIIYRADLIDWRLFQGSSPLGKDPTDRYKMMQQFLDAATIWLVYSEGFPALPTGEPLWAKLPFEDSSHYAAFTDYCTLIGARQLASLDAKYPKDQVLQWYHEDYWNIRVKCYDMLNAIHAAKVREQRIMACEDDHYLQAEKMMNSLKEKMAAVDWEVLVGDPKQFVEVMERVAKLQRVSLGLSSMGNSNDKRETTAETLEVRMRRIAEPNLIEDKRADGGIDVRQLLKNPDALASAQELIIKMTKTITHNPNQTQSDQETAE